MVSTRFEVALLLLLLLLLLLVFFTFHFGACFFVVVACFVFFAFSCCYFKSLFILKRMKTEFKTKSVVSCSTSEEKMTKIQGSSGLSEGLKPQRDIGDFKEIPLHEIEFHLGNICNKNT